MQCQLNQSGRRFSKVQSRISSALEISEEAEYESDDNEKEPIKISSGALSGQDWFDVESLLVGVDENDIGEIQPNQRDAVEEQEAAYKFLLDNYVHVVKPDSFLSND